MKRKDKDELRTMDISALTKKAQDLSKQMDEARQTMMTKEVKNRHAVKVLRQKRAVVLSILREKSLAAESKGVS